jgi:hypothetical protein
MEEPTKKKAVAKKATKKEPSRDVLIRDFLIKNPLDRVSRTVAKRYYKIKVATSYHPRKAEDVENLLILLAGCDWIDINCMKGYCKLWDVVVDDWDKIAKMFDEGRLRELNALLAGYEKPYQNGPQNNFQDALYE